jgi:mannose/fructose-specific phosphotransferase system component IIA
MKFAGILPFMESEELRDLAFKIISGEQKGVKLVMLYPFLNNDHLEEVIDKCIEENYSKYINMALPFASSKTVRKIYEAVKEGTLTGINSNMLFPFLDKELRKSVFDDLIKKANESGTAEDDDLDDEDFDLEDDFEEENEEKE